MIQLTELDEIPVVPVLAHALVPLVLEFVDEKDLFKQSFLDDIEFL